MIRCCDLLCAADPAIGKDAECESRYERGRAVNLFHSAWTAGKRAPMAWNMARHGYFAHSRPGWPSVLATRAAAAQGYHWCLCRLKTLPKVSRETGAGDAGMGAVTIRIFRNMMNSMRAAHFVCLFQGRPDAHLGDGLWAASPARIQRTVAALLCCFVAGTRPRGVYTGQNIEAGP